MSKDDYILLSVLIHILISGVPAIPGKIPFGTIFKRDSQEAITALQYVIHRYNSSESQAQFQLEYQIDTITEDSLSASKAICKQLEKGIFLLLGYVSTSSYTTLQSYSSNFHLPLIHVSPDPNYGKNISRFPNLAYQLNLRPMYVQAIVDLIHHYKWQKIFFVYDSDEGLLTLQQLFRHVTSDMMLQIHAHRVVDETDGLKFLGAIDRKHPQDQKHVVLDTSFQRAQALFINQIHDIYISRRTFHYLLVRLGVDELDFSTIQFGGINITGFRMIDENSKVFKQFIKEWQNLDPHLWPGGGKKRITNDAALMIDSFYVFIQGMTNLLRNKTDIFRNNFRRGEMYNQGIKGMDCNKYPDILQWEHGYLLMDYFKKVKVHGLTGHIEFDNQLIRRNYSIEVIEMSINRGPAKIGNWNETHGFTPETPNFIRTTLKGRENKTLIVTTILQEPYMMEKKDGVETYEGNERYDGYCKDLTELLANKMKFTYEIRQVKDGKYGTVEADGRWSGMVGELMRHEADLAVAPLTITSERERVIDFSKPFMSLGISIMIKKPVKQKPGVFSFMNPLSYEIWMCIIFAYIGVSVVLFLVSRFSPYEWRIEESITGPKVSNDFTIYNSLWFSLGAFMRQGCDISPRSMSGRIVGSVWWFFTLIIISSYTANLAAFLTVERMVAPINSADDLAKQTEVEYGTLDSGSTKEFFRKSKISVYERMWEFMNSRSKVFEKTVTAGVARVRNSKGKYAFLLESTMNDFINERQPCDTMKVGSNLDSKGYGVATPLGSDLREEITFHILQLKEDGDLQKLENKWWYDKGECGPKDASSKDASQNELTLSNVAGIFYILIGGLVLAMVMALLEFCYKSRVEARRSKMSFTAAMRSKARMSIRGSDRDNRGVGTPAACMHDSMSTVPLTCSNARDCRV